MKAKKKFNVLPFITVGLVVLAFVGLFFGFVEYKEESVLFALVKSDARSISVVFNGFNLIFGGNVTSTYLSSEGVEVGTAEVYAKALPVLIIAFALMVAAVVGLVVSSLSYDGKKKLLPRLVVAALLVVAGILVESSFSSFISANEIVEESVGYYTQAFGVHVTAGLLFAGAVSHTINQFVK